MQIISEIIKYINTFLQKSGIFDTYSSRLFIKR